MAFRRDPEQTTPMSTKSIALGAGALGTITTVAAAVFPETRPAAPFIAMGAAALIGAGYEEGDVTKAKGFLTGKWNCFKNKVQGQPCPDIMAVEM